VILCLLSLNSLPVGFPTNNCDGPNKSLFKPGPVCSTHLFVHPSFNAQAREKSMAKSCLVVQNDLANTPFFSLGEIVQPHPNQSRKKVPNELETEDLRKKLIDAIKH
jgi:hypothetical protein